MWDAPAEHFDETQLGALVVDIATVNLWNRCVLGPVTLGRRGAVPGDTSAVP